MRVPDDVNLHLTPRPNARPRSRFSRSRVEGTAITMADHIRHRVPIASAVDALAASGGDSGRGIAAPQLRAVNTYWSR
jgi:hypothetical protein